MVNFKEEVEIDLLLTGIKKVYGYDFSNYAETSLKRRIRHYCEKYEYTAISALIPDMIHQPEKFGEFFRSTNIGFTEMFRDPAFFKFFRDTIIPKVLKTYSFSKIWIAGCSTGEEVYTVAIILHEAGLSDKVHIYATDFNDESLQHAKRGIFPVDKIKKYTKNYQRSGGMHAFGEYFHSKYDYAKLSDSLKQNVTFSFHNLVTDGVFGEMNLILCRNVLIYFNQALQDRVLKLFSDSLCYNGILCLGDKESLRFSEFEPHFKVLSRSEKVYQKKKYHA